MRNQTKFEEAELHLNFEKKQVDKTNKDLLEKLEELRINLSVKFFQKIQTEYMESLDNLFSTKNNVQNELQDLYTKDVNGVAATANEKFNEDSGYVEQQ